MALALVLGLSCPTGAWAQPRVGHIEISPLDRTHSQTVRRELLFKSGDVLDSASVAESLRNLRRLPFLANPRLEFSQAQVITTLPDTLPVNIKVLAQDRYARALSPLLSGAISSPSLGLVGLDYNFRGRGQTVQLTAEHRNVGGQRLELLYQVPRLLNSQYDIESRNAIAAEGHLLSLVAARPYRTLATRRAYGLSMFHQSSLVRLYHARTLSARYRDAHQAASMWYGLSLGQRFKVRPSLRLDFSSNDYVTSGAFSFAPQDRRRVVASTSLTLWQPRYVQDSYINSLGITEDIQTGSWAVMRLGASLRSLGSDRQYPFGQLTLTPRFSPWPHAYILGSLFFSSRWDRGSYANMQSSAQLKLISRIGTTHSLALRLYANLLSRSENNAQYLIGVENGLRGYPPRSFDGTRRLVGNISWRPTLLAHPAYVLAGAVFTDVAIIGPSSQSTWKKSAGLGLRLGLTQVYNSPVLRLDLAQGSVLQVSFGIGHYF
jgi:hypothetical protein